MFSGKLFWQHVFPAVFLLLLWLKIFLLDNFSFIGFRKLLNLSLFPWPLSSSSTRSCGFLYLFIFLSFHFLSPCILIFLARKNRGFLNDFVISANNFPWLENLASSASNHRLKSSASFFFNSFPLRKIFGLFSFFIKWNLWQKY